MQNFNITAQIQTILGLTEIQFESKEYFGSGSDLFMVEVSFPKVNQEDSEKIAFSLRLEKLEQKRLKGLSVFNMFSTPKKQTDCLERILQIIKTNNLENKEQAKKKEANKEEIKKEQAENTAMNYATNDGIAGLA